MTTGIQRSRWVRVKQLRSMFFMTIAVAASGSLALLAYMPVHQYNTVRNLCYDEIATTYRPSVPEDEDETVRRITRRYNAFGVILAVISRKPYGLSLSVQERSYSERAIQERAMWEEALRKR